MSDVDRIPQTAGAPVASPSVPTHAGATRVASRPIRAWRALVAAAVSAAMLLVMLGVAVFAQSGRDLQGPTFLPADSPFYAEARLDLPGDQRDSLMAFLAHLPGFSDGAALDSKLDQLIDKMLGGDDSPVSWAEDIAPWFGGQVMLGLTAMPPIDPSTDADDAVESAPVVIGLSVTDRTALDTAMQKVLAAAGGSATSQEHAGTTIWVVGSDSDQPTAVAATDSVLLVGNGVAQVESALDVLAGTTPSLADDAGFQAAYAALPSDRLGAFWADTAQIKDALGPIIAQQLAGQAGAAGNAAQLESMLALLPPWVAGVLAVQPDSLQVRLDAPVVEGAPAVSIRSTDLASKMPAGSSIFVELRDVGSGVRGLLAQLKQAMAAQGNDKALAQIEALLGTDLEAYLDWMEDAAIAASLDTTGPSIGLVATVTDPATAQQRLGSLLGLVRAIAASADPSPVEISTADVDGVTVTTIALAADAAGMAGDLPVEPRISLALDDDHLYLGLGDFAAEALQRDPADSLASSPGFTKALAAVGEAHGGLVYLDVASMLSTVESFMSPSDRESYEAQVKPYADVLDVIVGAIGQSDGTSSATLMLFVR